MCLEVYIIADENTPSDNVSLLYIADVGVGGSDKHVNFLG